MYRVPVKTLCSITHRVMVRLLSGLRCTSETTGTCEHAPKDKTTPHTIKIRFIIHLPKSLDERRLEVENYFRNSAIYSAKKHYSIAFQPKPDRQFCLIFLKGFSNPGAGITCLIFTLSDFQRNVKGKVNETTDVIFGPDPHTYSPPVIFGQFLVLSSSGPAGVSPPLSSSGLTRRSRGR